MEIITDTVDDDGVSSVISARASCADLDLLTEDVDEFSFSLVAPLSSQHDSRHFVAAVPKPRYDRFLRGVF
jgi:hypothetical protein